jgi:NAD dependent epimerase/dehydratase
MIHYSARSDWGNLEFLPPQQKSALRVVAGNIEDGDFVDRQVKGKTVVFHLAALIGIPYSYISPRSYVRTNIEGSLNLLEAARKHEVERFVHTSTSETYGTAMYTPIDESHPLKGQSPYSASKIGADKIAESYHLSFGVPVATVRPFNTYGPRQSARAVIPTIISQALTRDEVQLGALDPVRDLTYVKDTVDAFIKVAQAEEAIGEVINVGAGAGIQIGELAQKILSLIPCDKSVTVDQSRERPPNSEVFKLICDNRKAAQKAGWTPSHSLSDGLSRTIDFISNHLELYKSHIYSV